MSLVARKIKSITRNEEPVPVYDIQVKKNHNFFANRSLVHNCIVFQEQLMQLCSVVAGFPEEDTDQVRRFLLKRKASEAKDMFEKAKAIKDQFVEGSVANGVDRRVADDLYEKMLFFAGYGFNLSHAVAYAIDSYYCAWLLTYHEEEWLNAYLDAMSADSVKLKVAIGEVKAMGYEIVPLDVNYAGVSWTLLPGKKFMPSLSACKGVGSAAVNEIIAKRPYASIEEFLWDEDGSWKHSKCNKATVSALIKARAFDSLDSVGSGKTFVNYNQMHDVIIEGWNDLRKVLKTNPNYARERFRELIDASNDTPDWTPAEVAKNLTNLFGAFDVADVIDRRVLRKLASTGIRSVDDAEEQPDLYWFVVAKATPKLTKNGKPYLLFDALGDSGSTRRIFCWGWDGKTALPDYSLVVAEVKTNDFGCATKFGKLRVI